MESSIHHRWRNRSRPRNCTGATPLRIGATPLRTGATPLRSGATPLRSGARRSSHMVSGCLERSVPPCFSLGPALLTTVTIPGTVTLRRT